MLPASPPPSWQQIDITAEGPNSDLQKAQHKIEVLSAKTWHFQVKPW